MTFDVNVIRRSRPDHSEICPKLEHEKFGISEHLYQQMPILSRRFQGVPLDCECTFITWTSSVVADVVLCVWLWYWEAENFRCQTIQFQGRRHCNCKQYFSTAKILIFVITIRLWIRNCKERVYFGGLGCSKLSSFWVLFKIRYAFSCRIVKYAGETPALFKWLDKSFTVNQWPGWKDSHHTFFQKFYEQNTLRLFGIIFLFYHFARIKMLFLQCNCNASIIFVVVARLLRYSRLTVYQITCC